MACLQPPVRGLGLETGTSTQADLVGMAQWARSHGHPELAARCSDLLACSPCGATQLLDGPTGEANLYAVLPRQAVLCLADNDGQRLLQLAAVLAVGSQALWPASAQALAQRLPTELQERITLARDWQSDAADFDAVFHHGPSGSLREVGIALAKRPGRIIPMESAPPEHFGVALERLVVERSISLNTAAAGGNASLMTLG